MRAASLPFSSSAPSSAPPAPARAAEDDPAPAEALRWAAAPIRERLAVIRRFRHALASDAKSLAGALTDANPRRASDARTLAAELLPLASAARYLEKHAPRLLRPRRVGALGRPAWLPGVRGEVRRVPHGTTLILGPSNYPLMLPGVQGLQALAAGNAVILKPGRGGALAAHRLADLLQAAGLARGLFTVTGESDQAGVDAIESGSVDHVVLTGSADAGRAVLARCANKLMPATMELGGWDAAWVGPRAEVGRVARLLTYGITLNAGATCLAPHRVFAHHRVAKALETRLSQRLAETDPVWVGGEAAARIEAAAAEAVAGGARLVCGGRAGGEGETARPWVLADVDPAMAVMREDLFGPVMSIMAVADEAAFVRANQACPYRLGAAVFDGSRALVDAIPAGSVTVEDVIAPTADPRLPFAGWGASGFGVTRGAEGLLAMTRLQVVTRRRGALGPHAQPRWADDAGLFVDYLQAAHGRRWGPRLKAGGRLLGRVMRKGTNHDDRP